MSSMTGDTVCYLCGSSDCGRIHNQIRYGLPPRPYKCNNCGFVFLYPHMSLDDEKKFYAEQYRMAYANESPEELWKESLPEAKKRAARFSHHFSREKRVLEVGCASGFFLHEIRESVGSVTGIELTENYVLYANSIGLDVRRSLDEVPDNSFDVIFMFHVLEHINDPIAYLMQIRNKLAPDGKLIIEVPNVEDILVSVYKIKQHLDFYWEIAHNFYFSKSSLGTVLQKAGYNYDIFPLQRYDLSNHIYWMLYGKPGGKGFFNSIFSESLEYEYEKCLKEKFLCDTIYAIAEK